MRFDIVWTYVKNNREVDHGFTRLTAVNEDEAEAKFLETHTEYRPFGSGYDVEKVIAVGGVF